MWGIPVRETRIVATCDCCFLITMPVCGIRNGKRGELRPPDPRAWRPEGGACRRHPPLGPLHPLLPPSRPGACGPPGPMACFNLLHFVKRKPSLCHSPKVAISARLGNEGEQRIQAVRRKPCKKRASGRSPRPLGEFPQKQHRVSSWDGRCSDRVLWWGVRVS